MTVIDDEIVENARQQVIDNPSDPESWYNLSCIFMSAKQYEEAVDILTKFVEIDPYFLPAWTLLAEANDRLGENELAIRCYENGLQNDKRDLFSLKRLAALYHNKNKETKVTDNREIEILESLDAIEPLVGWDLNRIAVLHFQRSELHRSIFYWERGIKSSEAIPEFYGNLALCYSRGEIGRYADAVDVYRLCLEIKPDYEKARKGLEKVLRISKLTRQECPLDYNKYRNHDAYKNGYINPFALLGVADNIEYEEINSRMINKHKRRLLMEIELEDGELPTLPGVILEKSDAIRISESLFDESNRLFHWNIFKDKKLLNFLTKEDLSHFEILYNNRDLNIIKLANCNTDFIERLSEPFSNQYSFILAKSISKRNWEYVRLMTAGRLWVSASYLDKCFEPALKETKYLVKPLKLLCDSSESKKITADRLNEEIERNGYRIICSLPIFFRSVQDIIAGLIIDIAVSSYNDHDDPDNSRKILSIVEGLNNFGPIVKERLNKSISSIDNIIAKIREHEAYFSIKGQNYAITNYLVKFGDREVGIENISGFSWGIVSVSGDHVEFSIDFREISGEVESIKWTERSDQEKSVYENVINATLEYIMPSVYKRVFSALENHGQETIGPFTITREGVSFIKYGWIRRKLVFIPWRNANASMNNGTLTISNQYRPKDHASTYVRDTMNAFIILPLLDHYKEKV